MGEPTALKASTDHLLNPFAKDFTVAISGASISAEINAKNSQLFSLKRENVDVMWPGGAPESRRPKTGWQNSSPEMFPIIGSAPGDKILVDGIYYQMVQHGIARDLPWELTRSNSQSVTFEQAYDAMSEVPSSKGTSKFPRCYWLTKTYEIKQSELTYTLEIYNKSARTMPYFVGWHPAFRSLEPSMLKVMQENAQKTSLTLSKIREAPRNTIEFIGSNKVRYENNEFSLILSHNFADLNSGGTQIWDRGDGCVAIEPISGSALSWLPKEAGDVELALQPGCRILKPGKNAVYTASLSVALR